MEPDLSADSPVLYFRERLRPALRDQGVRLDESAEFYIVHLVASQVRLDPNPLSGPLGVALIRSGLCGSSRDMQRVGDAALLLAGFWWPSLQRSLVDVDYYIAVGKQAYGSLEEHLLGETFLELSREFPGVASALIALSLQWSDQRDRDLLRLYEVWQKSNSRALGRLLLRYGIDPLPFALRPQ